MSVLKLTLLCYSPLTSICCLNLLQKKSHRKSKRGHEAEEPAARSQHKLNLTHPLAVVVHITTGESLAPLSVPQPTIPSCIPCETYIHLLCRSQCQVGQPEADPNLWVVNACPNCDSEGGNPQSAGSLHPFTNCWVSCLFINIIFTQITRVK